MVGGVPSRYSNQSCSCEYGYPFAKDRGGYAFAKGYSFAQVAN
jgi:hypothetical protein